MPSNGGPGFVCIGAQKAGTTWLWEILREHPEVWLPPVKELHWFDVKHPPAELGGRFTFRHRTGWRRYTPLLRSGAWRDLPWLIRFYHGALEGKQSYNSLFQREVRCLTGEITPAYAILDEEAVVSIHSQLPLGCRIVLILREPVDRLWSGLRMHCRKRGQSIDALSMDEIDRLANRPDQALRSDYGRTLRNWSRFGDRLGVFFFEDMLQDPGAFLAQILAFLDLDPDWKPNQVGRVSNPGGASAPPPIDLVRKWRVKFTPTVDAVREHVGRVPPSWESVPLARPG
jgi:hypothetical protein